MTKAGTRCVCDCVFVKCQMLIMILGICWTTFVLMSMLKWHVKCQVSNAYIDPWDILNNFCFHVYAKNVKWQKLEPAVSVTVSLSNVKCLWWRDVICSFSILGKSTRVMYERRYLSLREKAILLVLCPALRQWRRDSKRTHAKVYHSARDLATKVRPRERCSARICRGVM